MKIKSLNILIFTHYLYIYTLKYFTKSRRIQLYFKGIGSPRFLECSQILSFRKDDNVHAEEKVAILSVIAPLFLSTSRHPWPFGLELRGIRTGEGFERFVSYEKYGNARVRGVAVSARYDTVALYQRSSTENIPKDLH